MKLAKWLADEGITVTEFARRLNRPQPTILRYVNGDRTPEPEIMAAIAEATDRKVMPNDFYDIAPAGSPDIPAPQPERQAS